MIGVVGPTGQVGGTLTRRLIADNGSVRALTRNPEKTARPCRARRYRSAGSPSPTRAVFDQPCADSTSTPNTNTASTNTAQGGLMASTRQWFESLAEAQRRAKKHVPRSVYDALLAGAEQGITLRDNVGALGELGFVPRIAELPGTGAPGPRDQATTVLGQQISLPVIISPTGVQAVHPARSPSPAPRPPPGPPWG
jgi:hypothetical protein